MLHTFVDAFQGHYKDGIEPGTRDRRWFASVYFLGRIIILHVVFGITQDVLCYGLTGIFILLSVLVTAMLQPYKSTKVNIYHISIQLVIAIACFLIALLDQATIKDRWLMHPVVYLIGVVCILPLLFAVFNIAYKKLGRDCALYQEIVRSQRTQKMKPDLNINPMMIG